MSGEPILEALRLEVEYQQKRADDALDLLRQEKDAAREREARYVEERVHLQRGIDVLRSAYLSATAVRPQAKRPEIEGWIAEDLRREEDRQRGERTANVQTLRPDFPWSDQ